MFEIKNLKKSYNIKKSNPVQALKGINLTFVESGLNFILGKSGSGKSTLLHLLGGLDKPDEGDVIWNGARLNEFREKELNEYRNFQVGFVFQDYNLLPEFSVRENIAIALELQKRQWQKEEIESALRQVELEGVSERKPAELSGGQRQRVAIARAIIKNSKIILADEPTGALDEDTGRSILHLLKEISKEKLVIVVSHDRNFAETFGDRVIELSDGMIINDNIPSH